MILQAETLIEYGYLPLDLNPESNRPVLAACDNCGKVRKTSKHMYRALCRSCVMKGNTCALGHMLTEEVKAEISTAVNANYLSGNLRAKISGENNHRWRGGRKAAWARHRAKRKRQLGYTLLMPLKEGEQGHHIRNEFVIGIPAEIHQSIGGGTRTKHRTRVLEWLKINDKKKYALACLVLLNEKERKHDNKET